MAEKVTDPALLKRLEGSPETEAAEATGEPIGSGKDAGLYSSLVSGFSSDESEMVRFLAKRLYPNEPLEKSTQRFGKRNGVIFHRADDGEIYEALPRGMVPTMAASVGPSIPLAAGAATGIATSPISASGVGAPVGIAATMGAAAGGDALRQGIGNVMMGDEATPGLEAGPILEQAATAGVGQVAGLGMNALATKNAVRDISRYDPTATRQAYSEANKVNLPLTPSEATGLKSLGAQEKRLSNIAPTADEMSEFYANRDKSIVQRWNEYLDTISTHSDAEPVGKFARDTSQAVLKDMRAQLQATAKPLYDKAYATPVPFTAKLEELTKVPIFKKAVANAKTLADNDPENGAKQFFAVQAPDRTWQFTRVPNMREWDYVKRGFDEILGSKEVVNETTGGMNNYGRIVKQRKDELLGELDKLVPEYALARETYSDSVEDVSGAVGSALGILAKTKDVNVVNAARHIFDPAGRSPAMIRQLRSYIEPKDPAAWQAIKRLYMSNLTTDALKTSEQGEVLNVAGKLHKAFTNPKMQDNLFAAMSPDERRRYADLMVVLKRIASSPKLRSDTAFNMDEMRRAENAAAPLHSKILGYLNPAEALRAYKQWRVDANIDRQASAMVKIITSGDPQSVMALKELRRLSISDKGWITVLGHLLTRVGVYGTKSALPETSYEPPADQLRDAPIPPPFRNQPAGPRVSGAVP